MNRREFGKIGAAVVGSFTLDLPTAIDSLAANKTYAFRTRHLIWIVNGNGARKRDYYQNPLLSPNCDRIAREGFVYEESYNETVSRHGPAWVELMTGNRLRPGFSKNPTAIDYVRTAYGDGATNYWTITNGRLQFRNMDFAGLEKHRVRDFMEATTRRGRLDLNLRNLPLERDPFTGDAIGLAMVPDVMKAFKPRILVCHQLGHDAAHGNGGYPRQQTGYSEYERVCRTTDEQIGRIFDFVRSDPYFSTNTTILIRPEFGRDDEVTRYGELHHSTGYYQSHHSAEIWCGPDIKRGVDRTLKNRLDVAPTLTRLFNVEAPQAIGRVHPEMFKSTVAV